MADLDNDASAIPSQPSVSTHPTSLILPEAPSKIKGLPHATKPYSQVPVDLRLLDYVSEFDRNLMCPVCHCPFIEPVRLGCDHTFCRHCLSRSLQNQSSETKTCPSCRTPTAGADGQHVPRFLIHMIDELIVKCPKAGVGCELRIKRGDVQDHVDLYCSYTDVACPSPDCKFSIPRKDCGKSCLHRKVSCERCKEVVMEVDLGIHQESKCPKSVVQCLHCGDEVVQHSLPSHKDQCPKVERPCLAADIGCQAVAQRADIAQHEQSCVLVALLPTITSMRQRIDDQNEAMRIMRHKNDVLEGCLTAMQSILGQPSSTSDAHHRDPQPAASRSVVQQITSSESPPFDSATHHLLSLHETLREEIDRVSAAVSEVDARSSVMVMNETLRLKEDMAHTNAVVGSMRMQLQWLTSARLQAHPRTTAATTSATASTTLQDATAQPTPGQPTRRLSDSSRQDTKL